MKKIKIILSVTTFVMTLFIMSLANNIHAEVYYREGYDNIITDEECYVDEIRFDDKRSGSFYNNFYNYVLKAKSVGDTKKSITKIRTITGEYNTNILKTVAEFNLGTSKFTVEYNGEVYFYAEVTPAIMYDWCYVGVCKNINFNDPSDPNCQNCERVLMSAPRITTKYFTEDIDVSEYEGYEDFVSLVTYDVKEIQEICDNPINLPSRDVLLKRDIELSSGLKIEGKDNIAYGGNYNLEEGKTIDNGTYYLKVAAPYNDETYYIIYKIIVCDMLKELPRIYVSENTQLTEYDIIDHVLENNITNFTYNAESYYKFFDTPGIYYITINYTYDNKSYEAKFPVYVLPNDNQRLKIKDESLLRIGYNDYLELIDFEDNLDFSYIEVKEYNIDYSNYEDNHNIIGTYKIFIYIKDIYGILYINQYEIEVYDNICPNISFDENVNLIYSYTNNIDIERIVSNISVSDASNYKITYDTNELLERENKIGIFNIYVKAIDDYDNESNYTIEIEIIDDVSPKIITKTIYANTETALDINTIKSQIYVNDEVDGIINNELITLNDVNGYKENYNVEGTYHFEITATDASNNEAYGSFDIVVSNEEIVEEINVINVDKNNPLSKGEILAYLVEKGYIPDNNYELSSAYFESDTYDENTYQLEVIDNDSEENLYFEIKMNDSNVVYDTIVIEEEEVSKNNSAIFIIISVIVVVVVASGILGVIIYKKRH